MIWKIKKHAAVDFQDTIPLFRQRNECWKKRGNLVVVRLENTINIDPIRFDMRYFLQEHDTEYSKLHCHHKRMPKKESIRREKVFSSPTTS